MSRQGKSRCCFFPRQQDQTPPAEAAAQLLTEMEGRHWWYGTDSPMAGGGGGGLPLELSLATAGTSAAAAAADEPWRGVRGQRVRQRTVPALYAELAALLNLSSPRVSQEEVVAAAVERVRVLEDTAAVLEAYRAVASRGAPRPEVSVVTGGATACFSVRLPPATPGLLTRVLTAFERRGVDVLVATVARHGGAAVVTVTAAAAAPEAVEMVRADIAAIQ
ncbi:hypothetical protein ACP70R_032604 [Stipagrostis hirtigluma subsp. patula]